MALRTTTLHTPLGTALGALLAATLGTALPAAPASGAATRVETRVLPASAAWSVPVEILESGAVVGNDAAAGSLYGWGDIALDGGTRPWAWSGRARRDLSLAGRPSGRVLDAAETGVAVGGLTEPSATATRSLAVRWRATGTATLLLPEVRTDTLAVNVNLRADALANVTVPNPDTVDLSQVVLITAAGERRTVVPGALAYARSLNTRREALYTTYSAGGVLGSGYWRDGVATPLPAGSFREPVCLSELTETGFFAWRNRSFEGGAVLRAANGTERRLTAGGRWVDVGCLRGADAVSEWGHVVGTAYPGWEQPPGPPRAVLWRGAGEPLDVGTLGSDAGSWAVAVNERDHVLAQSVPDGGYGETGRPFLRRAGRVIELPVPAGFDQAVGIDLNNRGHVLGLAVRHGPGDRSQARTVVWTVR